MSTYFLHAKPCPICEAEIPVSPQSSWRAGVDSYSSPRPRTRRTGQCKDAHPRPHHLSRSASHQRAAPRISRAARITESNGVGTSRAGFGPQICMPPRTRTVVPLHHARPRRGTWTPYRRSFPFRRSSLREDRLPDGDNLTNCRTTCLIEIAGVPLPPTANREVRAQP